VEAAGIEPASENDLHKASTGLVRVLRLAAGIAHEQAAQQPARQRFRAIRDEQPYNASPRGVVDNSGLSGVGPERRQSHALELQSPS